MCAVSIACILALSSGLARQDVTPTPKRVLVYTVSAGYEHEVVHRESPEKLSLVERALVELGRKDGRFEAVPSRDANDFTPEKLARFDLVFFYTTGELPFSAEQRTALLDFVRRGKAFAGAHCATDTFYEVPEYGEMIGAYFDGHPWHESVRVKVEDASHLATRHLGTAFDIVDEIYQFKVPYDRRKSHILLSLDAERVDLARDGVHRTDRDFAVAWCREFGRGRVFYTSLGHRPEVWADERFLKHIEGGFRWAMRAEEVDEPKRAEPPKSPRLPESSGAPRAPAPISPGPLLAGRARAIGVDEYRDHARRNRGDPARGYALFRSPAGSMCIRCHLVNGAGANVGPDLSDVAVKYGKDELITSVLEPSRRIAEGYRTAFFELDDGRMVFGQIKSETAQAVTLFDTRGEIATIDTRSIARRGSSDTSVMPDGLASTLSLTEFSDLVAYLMTLRGSPGPKR